MKGKEYKTYMWEERKIEEGGKRWGGINKKRQDRREGKGGEE